MSLLLFASLLFGASFSMFVPNSDKGSVRIREIVKQQIFQTNLDLDARLQRLEIEKVENAKRVEVMHCEINALKLENIHLKKEVGLLRDYINADNINEDEVMVSEETLPDTENLQAILDDNNKGKVGKTSPGIQQRHSTQIKKHPQGDGRTAQHSRSANLGYLTTYNSQNTSARPTYNSQDTHSVDNSQDTHHVAFYAWLGQVISPVVRHQAIPFSGVRINIGGAYDSKTGKFQCQHRGTYVFSWTASIQKTQPWLFDSLLILNGRIINDLYIGEDIQGHARGSNTFIVNLRSGDEVWISSNPSRNHGGVQMNSASSFSGFKLY